jgi:hypothetical protein
MANTKNKFDETADAFFHKLPEADYPKALIEGYPRIAEKIFSLRNDKKALGAYFESLLTIERSSRQGFPFPVIVNIQSLYDMMVGISDGFVRTNRMRRDGGAFTSAPKTK